MGVRGGGGGEGRVAHKDGMLEGCHDPPAAMMVTVTSTGHLSKRSEIEVKADERGGGGGGGGGRTTRMACWRGVMTSNSTS